MNAGNSFKFLLGNSRRYHQAFQLGAWARVANKLETGKLVDAFILSTRFDYEQFTIGFSYDINTSSLYTASRVSARRRVPTKPTEPPPAE